MADTVLVGSMKSMVENFLITASNNIICKYKKSLDWRNVFVNAGKFFIDYEQYPGQIFNDLESVLSQKNMIEVANNLKGKDGYELKDKLLNEFLKLIY